MYIEFNNMVNRFKLNGKYKMDENPGQRRNYCSSVFFLFVIKYLFLPDEAFSSSMVLDLTFEVSLGNKQYFDTISCGYRKRKFFFCL